jgi:hypothetical protein
MRKKLGFAEENKRQTKNKPVQSSLQEKGKLLLCSWEREKKVQKKKKKKKKEEELVGVKKNKKNKKKKELVGVKKICCWVGVQI